MKTESKTFLLETPLDFKRAERYQARLYKKYESVTIIPIGLSHVKIIGKTEVGAKK